MIKICTVTFNTYLFIFLALFSPVSNLFWFLWTSEQFRLNFWLEELHAKGVCVFILGGVSSARTLQKWKQLMYWVVVFSILKAPLPFWWEVLAFRTLPHSSSHSGQSWSRMPLLERPTSSQVYFTKRGGWSLWLSFTQSQLFFLEWKFCCASPRVQVRVPSLLTMPEPPAGGCVLGGSSCLCSFANIGCRKQAGLWHLKKVLWGRHPRMQGNCYLWLRPAQGQNRLLTNHTKTHKWLVFPFIKIKVLL